MISTEAAVGFDNKVLGKPAPENLVKPSAVFSDAHIVGRYIRDVFMDSYCIFKTLTT